MLRFLELSRFHRDESLLRETIFIDHQNIMLCSAFQVSTVSIDNIILIVFASLGLWDIVSGSINLVWCSGAGAARFPLDVLQLIGAVNYPYSSFPWHGFLGDAVEDIASANV